MIFPTRRRGRLSLLFLVLLAASTTAFLPQSTRQAAFTTRWASKMTASTGEEANETTEKASSAVLRVPLTTDEMVRQVAAAMREAAAAGTTRQIVRLLLPRDPTSDDFGKLFEDESQDASSRASLVPPDESWQGGIMQLYRAAAPVCSSIVRRLNRDATVPPRVAEDRSVDESGVDGVGLLTTDDGSVTCWVQPTQEVVGGFVASAEEASPGEVVVLVNPQWRQVDDALDSASRGEGFLSGLANFLGGKGGALKRTAEAGFQPVYTLEGYVCRGANVRIMQTAGTDWHVFCERDDKGSYKQVGTAPSRPSYQEVEAMLQESGIGYKYARDIGLSPKL